MKRGLSALQKSILLMAAENPSRNVQAWQVLAKVYGFRVTMPFHKIRFNRDEVGLKRYLSSTATVCRSFNRLAERGLAERLWGDGIHLTAAGERVAEEIKKRFMRQHEPVMDDGN